MNRARSFSQFLTDGLPFSNGRSRLLVFLVSILFSVAFFTSKAAPVSLGSGALGLVVASGQAPLADTGYAFLVAEDSGNILRVVNISGFSNSQGNYSYTQGASHGLLDWSDLTGGNFGADFDFSDEFFGTYLLRDKNSGAQQNGDFIYFNGQAPASIAGRNLLCTINDGAAPYGSTGLARFKFSSSDNTYSLQGNGGNIPSSSGTYTYDRLNGSVAILQINDSVTGQGTLYLAFGSASTGSYGINSGNSFQVGDFIVTDDDPPTVAVTYPTNNQRLTTEVLTIAGTASDNSSVALVVYSLNGNEWFAASSVNEWKNWSADIVIKPGSNTLEICAIDGSGNLSPTNKLSFYYAVSAMLSVSVNNTNNRVSPNYDKSLLEIGRNYTLVAQPAAGFIFTNWTDYNGSIITNSASLQFTMRSGLALIANFIDVSKPLISVSFPKQLQRTSNSLLTVSGRVNDNDKISNIYLSINGSDWSAPTVWNGSSNWTANFTPLPGTNHLVAIALDNNGNYSKPFTIDFIHVPCSVFTVNSGPGGKISPSLNGALLPIGQKFTVTAVPKSGFAFSQWVDALGNIPTNRSTLTFIMQSNLAYTATFIDTSRPTLNLQVKQSEITNYSETIRISGRANDNDGIATVYIAANNNAWSNAANSGSWSNWWADVSLNPGANYFYAYAIDRSGNVSTTVRLKITLQTAPPALAGLRLDHFTDSFNSTEYTFSAKYFGQLSPDPLKVSGAGGYIYSKTGADSGRLQLSYSSPPKAASVGTKTMLLRFTSTKAGQILDGNGVGLGTFQLSSLADLTATSLVKRTIYYFGTQGDGQSSYYFSGKNYNTNLGTGFTYSGTTIYYNKFSPATTVIKQTNEFETVYIVSRYLGKDFGMTYTERYWPNGTLKSQDTGYFGLGSETSGAWASADITGRKMLVRSGGNSINLSFGNSTFAQSSFSDNFETGSGSYYYSASDAFTGNLQLNYSAPATLNGATDSAILSYFAPNLAYIRNTDSTVNIAIFDTAGNYANGSAIGHSLSLTNVYNGLVSSLQLGNDGSVAGFGSLNLGGTYSWSNFSPSSDMLELNISAGPWSGDHASLQLCYSSARRGTYKIWIFSSGNSLLNSEQGFFGHD